MDMDLVTSLLREPARIRLLDRDTVTSTNLLVKELGAQGAPEGTLMAAKEQTLGRGRLGRRFESPSGTGLYHTILLRPDLTLAQSVHITILAAVAVAEGIEETTGLRPEIKWVNDLYLGDRKICGILAESALRPGSDRIDYTALGIGINLAEPEGGFAGTAAGVAGALYPAGGCPAELPERLLAAIVNRVTAYYDELCEAFAEGADGAATAENAAGSSPAQALSYMARYRASDYLFGKDVWLVGDITRPDTARPARAVAIDGQGRLVVTLPDGSAEAVSFGEVTVRTR
ncbi:MAG: biotin--[acetyl-CoA-carboxylase] ligase [Lachnospiraceae bacterium]|nr:biotin--[acetyl-CoA-carboxylase] ligase [Lachnospiraceae bacterium]